MTSSKIMSMKTSKKLSQGLTPKRFKKCSFHSLFWLPDEQRQSLFSDPNLVRKHLNGLLWGNFIIVWVSLTHITSAGWSYLWFSNSLSVKLPVKKIPKNTLLSFKRQKKTQLLKKENMRVSYNSVWFWINHIRLYHFTCEFIWNCYSRMWLNP